jgi:hypothetical protein
MTAGRRSRRNVIVGGIVLATYINLVRVVGHVRLHALAKRSISDRSNDLVPSGAMWPKQIRFLRLMMRIFGDQGVMANERHVSQDEECPNAANGSRAGSESTSDQYQLVPAVKMG